VLNSLLVRLPVDVAEKKLNYALSMFGLRFSFCLTDNLFPSAAALQKCPPFLSFVIYFLFCNCSGASLSLPFPFFSAVSLNSHFDGVFSTDLTALMITDSFAFLSFFGFSFLLFSSLPFSASFSVTDAAKLGRTLPEFRAQLCRPGATKFLLFSSLQSNLYLRLWFVLVGPKIAEFCRNSSVPNSVFLENLSFKDRQ
jgi:hypothetical protein